MRKNGNRFSGQAVRTAMLSAALCAFSSAQSTAPSHSSSAAAQGPSSPTSSTAISPAQSVPATGGGQPSAIPAAPAVQALPAGNQTVAPQNAASPTQQTPGQNPAPSSGVQDATTNDQGRFVFKKQVEEVVLHATVVDAQGDLVPDLDRSAFSIAQNGKPEVITSFRREDVPVEIGIVVDNSGSMRDKRAKVNQAVMNLIRASNPDDESFVVNFGQTPYLDQDFTSDVNLLETALRQVSSRGSTALYDAVVASAVHLQNNSQLPKRVLLVITDGQDNMSRETLQDAMHKLQTKTGPTLYAIGLTDDELTPEGRTALQYLAASTGGAAFFPQNLEEVDNITRKVAHDIRHQYTLTYNPGRINAGGGYQRIQVEARAPGYGRLIVRTRSGYYPGESVR
jgi:Ca-activated chloride channel homolog